MSIPLILASKSKPRRDVLYSAGICPTIRVSHVDEPAALERAAAAAGCDVDDLTVDKRVAILAEAKAQAVHQAYRNVADTAAAATGERVIAYPLQTAEPAADQPSESADEGTVADATATGGESPRDILIAKLTNDQPNAHDADINATTRDFSGVDVPTQTEPISNIVAMQPGLTHAQVGPLIVGCDSMFLFDGECYGKPHSVEVARERLKAMRGHTGELWTGHCLIDFATGRVVRGVSYAKIHFCNYSDHDIERYLATGEPLEVAGSFTLEGFGGAFIDSIEGDPHGVIGISLPLLRELVGQLGIEWTDLWNVERGELFPNGKSDPSSLVPPAENVHQPGDGWVDCMCGRRHWGLNGASGVLLARRDAVTGAVTHVVMQHRAVWSAEGGTWGIPGGATADGESPIEGALRESYEEANITPEDIEVVGSWREDHGNWAYTTVFAFEKPGHTVELRANDDESMEIEWIPIDEVPNRKLLTAMKTDWPRFRARLDAIAAAHHGE
ncbi:MULTISPECIES: Maf family protein [Bifidobacterium]|uniref:Maf family protein n=1 Tax=Bifidobacterium sp. SO1 TaxID=2809029 RepID=UPI001BDD6BF0|nr:MULTISPECIES: Maf family protein [Bifidobacterium]MBT1161446.1 Maf family protein [Bifidobacterium sp. SO1]MBW3078987.1 Maf family protein [Bifidobacterium simiiventris]